ncbi:replication-relaxation family protein [Lentzea sp. NPDC006480]|uniref:replication-relaxation family protein n=1 Tax=Lentzea sp. NPDC006480 TaxID=3157176 RepID=UPI0033ACF5FF
MGNSAGWSARGPAHGEADVRRSESAGPTAETRSNITARQQWYRGESPKSRLRSDSKGTPHIRGRRDGRVGEPDAALWFRLVERDRRILALLHEHKVLTTNQIAAIEFSSIRRAQDRLRQLRELGAVFAFRDSYSAGGTSQTRYALGYRGARVIAAQRAEKPPVASAYAERLERLGLWPKLSHQLGVNDFFCGLAAFARTRPDAALTQWWSEKACTEFFWHGDIKLRPDAYGCWDAQGRRVRFFLEHDTGTEPLSKVVGKLGDYSRFGTDVFGILLFSVHSSLRERNLRSAMRQQLGYEKPGFVIATASRDHGRPDGPAGPIWAAWSFQDQVQERRRLAELPQRGPRIAQHVSPVGLPYSEAAWDPNDTTMTGQVTGDERRWE